MEGPGKFRAQVLDVDLLGLPCVKVPSSPPPARRIPDDEGIGMATLQKSQEPIFNLGKDTK